MLKSGRFSIDVVCFKLFDELFMLNDRLYDYLVGLC